MSTTSLKIVEQMRLVQSAVLRIHHLYSKYSPSNVKWEKTVDTELSDTGFTINVKFDVTCYTSVHTLLNPRAYRTTIYFNVSRDVPLTWEVRDPPMWWLDTPTSGEVIACGSIENDAECNQFIAQYESMFSVHLQTIQCMLTLTFTDPVTSTPTPQPTLEETTHVNS